MTKFDNICSRSFFFSCIIFFHVRHGIKSVKLFILKERIEGTIVLISLEVVVYEVVPFQMSQNLGCVCLAQYLALHPITSTLLLQNPKETLIAQTRRTLWPLSSPAINFFLMCFYLFLCILTFSLFNFNSLSFSLKYLYYEFSFSFQKIL